jgi:hypothetical protein
VGAAAQFKNPEGLCLLDSAALVLDFGVQLVRAVDLGPSAFTTTHAGSVGGFRDGPLAQAQFNFAPGSSCAVARGASAVVLEGVFGTVSQSVWSSLNHGVSGCASAAPLHTRPLSMLC